MIKPAQQDDVFLADVARIAARQRALHLWWLGQSGFLLHHRERYVLIDPYLSDSLTVKYARTEKPHVRMTHHVVDVMTLARQLRSVSLLTSSHAHTDHLDPDTLRPLIRECHVGRFLVPKAHQQLAYERAAASTVKHPPRFEGIDAGETVSADGAISVTAITAAHDSIERDTAGHHRYLGYVFRFRPFHVGLSGSAFSQPFEWTVYHSGDTVVYDGMVDILRPHNIDVAILPINGKVGNMGGRDAARLAKDIGARVVIPCHYEMFEFNTADPRDEFIPECERLGQPYRVLRAGERFSSDEIPGTKSA